MILLMRLVLTSLRTDNGNEKFNADIQCSIENSQGEVCETYSLKSLFQMQNGKRDSGKRNLLQEKVQEDDVLDSNLIIFLENCCMMTETVKCESQNSFPKHQLSPDLFRGLQMLLNEKPLADVTLNVSGTIIPAHKTILCARSPVFRSMLENEEMVNGIIEIDDIQSEIMEQFMSYLYTDTIGDDISLNAIRELYAIADKYQVGSLQDKCSSVLLENLNDETVCKTLKLADLHNDEI